MKCEEAITGRVILHGAGLYLIENDMFDIFYSQRLYSELVNGVKTCPIPCEEREASTNFPIVTFTELVGASIIPHTQTCNYTLRGRDNLKS